MHGSMVIINTVAQPTRNDVRQAWYVIRTSGHVSLQRSSGAGYSRYDAPHRMVSQVWSRIRNLDQHHPSSYMVEGHAIDHRTSSNT